MKKILVSVFALLIIAICGFVLTRSVRSYESSLPQTHPLAKPVAGKPSGSLPAAYYRLMPGMTAADVVALIGKPETRSLNPKFETKTPEQWAAIQAVVDSASSDTSVAPDRNVLKAGAELSHRIKETWQYDPEQYSSVRVFFDGGGHMVKWVTVVKPVF
jgi:hypothetical protein